jgi:hypothetical protein
MIIIASFVVSCQLIRELPAGNKTKGGNDMNPARELLESFFTKKKVLNLDRFDQFDWDNYDSVKNLLEGAQDFKQTTKEHFAHADLNEFRDFFLEQLAFFYTLAAIFNAHISVYRPALGISRGEGDKTPSGPGQTRKLSLVK